MKKTHQLLIILFLTCIATFQAKGDNYPYFFDSPQSGYYGNSWMDVTAPSTLECAGAGLRNFPVESVIPAYKGANCLRLKWRSVSGGNWSAIEAGDAWLQHNISNANKVSFYVYSQTALQAQYLPSIFMEDITNTRTSAISLSLYAGNIPANQWTRITVPMTAFYNAPLRIDFTNVKTIGFGQNQADNVDHTLYMDDIKVIYNYNSAPCLAPSGIIPKGYDSHTFLKWNPNTETNCGGYKVYLSTDGTNFNKRMDLLRGDTCYTDFVRGFGNNLNLKYKIAALNDDDVETVSAIINVSTYNMTDDQLLTMVQEATFRFYWDYANPVSGLMRERTGPVNQCAIGGSGFGVMAIVVGIERGFITRAQGLLRITKIVNFLTNTADRFHGVWPHMIDGNTGRAIPVGQDDGGDLVETSFMIEGLLTARQYFNGTAPAETTLRQKITNLWGSVEWDWYRKNNSNALYWLWSPNYGWNRSFPIQGYNEALIVYLLAIASPAHAVPASLYQSGWAGYSLYKNVQSYYGYQMDLSNYEGTHALGGPLFWTHFSFLGFDPRNKRDAYANYFHNNKAIALIDHAYCINNPGNYAGYNGLCWGLTASDGPNGYSAFEPSFNDNGTIAPTAAISSIVYTPQYSMDALKYFYRTQGAKLWGNMGFKDAFNLTQNWYDQGYISIDQGPIIGMIENYRSGLLWNKFMANPEIQPALEAIGFVPDITAIGIPAPTAPAASNVTIVTNVFIDNFDGTKLVQTWAPYPYAPTGTFTVTPNDATQNTDATKCMKIEYHKIAGSMWACVQSFFQGGTQDLSGYTDIQFRVKAMNPLTFIAKIENNSFPIGAEKTFTVSSNQWQTLSFPITGASPDVLKSITDMVFFPEAGIEDGRSGVMYIDEIKLIQNQTKNAVFDYIPKAGDVLTGIYTYSDVNDDPEQNTTFRWLSSANYDGNYTAISGATSISYTMQPSDVGKYIKFEVTPKTTIAPTTGITVQSLPTRISTYYDLHLADVPYVARENGNYGGAACAKMILDYEATNTLTQASIQTYAVANNTAPNINKTYIDPQGMYLVLNHYELQPGYNYAQLSHTSKADAYNDLCYWISNNIGNVNRVHMPSTVPVGGNFNNWMIVNGFQASGNPHSVSAYTVFGFYVKDPDVSGLGQDLYIQANIFSNYYRPIASWNNTYVSVNEPPVAKTVGVSNTVPFNYKPTTNELRYQAAEKGIANYHLGNDVQINAAYSGSTRGKIYFVSAGNYYIVCFDKNTMPIMAVTIDATSGALKEVTYTTVPDANYYAYLAGKGYPQMKSAKTGQDFSNPFYPLVGIVSEATDGLSEFTIEDPSLETENMFNILPNPASDYVKIGYSLEMESHVSINVYDLYGQQVKTVANMTQGAGRYNVTVNVQDLKTGVYLCRLTNGGETKVMKLVIRK